MKTKESKYVEKYYLSNYADGSVDEEMKAVGLFVAKRVEGRVLDCGCGPVPQLYAIFMPRMEELYAIDLPQESIDFVNKKISSVQQWYRTFFTYQKVIEEVYGKQPKNYILQQIAKIKNVQQADMSINLPFPDQYFDTAISFYSLGCLENEKKLEAAINNIRRVLKPGGKLLHVNTNGNNSNNDLPAYTWRGLDQSPKIIKKYLEHANFNITSEERVKLNASGDSMYKYSQISMLEAVKK